MHYCDDIASLPGSGTAKTTQLSGGVRCWCQVLVFDAIVNRSWGTSLEVGVRVRAQSPTSTEGDVLVNTIYITYVTKKDPIRRERPLAPQVPSGRPDNRFLLFHHHDCCTCFSYFSWFPIIDYIAIGSSGSV